MEIADNLDLGKTRVFFFFLLSLVFTSIKYLGKTLDFSKAARFSTSFILYFQLGGSLFIVQILDIDMGTDIIKKLLGREAHFNCFHNFCICRNLTEVQEILTSFNG